MKRYLSLAVLLSLFLIQIHGVNHSESDQSDRDHHCTVCKTVSHQPSLTPAGIGMNLTPDLALAVTHLVAENDFTPKAFIFKIINPRAPPSI